MKKNQFDTLNMYQSVNAVLLKMGSVWAANIPLTTAINLLKDNIGFIEGQRNIQNTDTTGVTENKENKRKNLEEQTYAAGSILKFYASSVDNRKLLEKVNFTRSELRNARDNELPGMAKQVHQEAAANAGAVLAFGLTNAMIDALEAALNDFVKHINKPREALLETSTATKQLPELYNYINRLLEEQIDSGMELYRISHPDEYSRYFKARIIVSSPTLKRALEVHVTDAKGAAIKNVKIVVDGSIYRSTSPLGNIRVQSLSQGAHSLTATLPGGVSVTQSFNVITGETTKIKLIIMPV